MQFHLPTDTEEKPKLTFPIKHALIWKKNSFRGGVYGYMNSPRRWMAGGFALMSEVTRGYY